MKIETLKDRISKTEEKIVNMQNTVSKKTAFIEKKKVGLTKVNDKQDRYWIECDIDWLETDVKRVIAEINETGKRLENYRKRLAVEIKRKEMFEKEVPETLKILQNELVAEWDAYDKKLGKKMRHDMRKLGYRTFCMKYRGQYTSLRNKSDEAIHSDNVRDAEAIIMNLINRIKHITGEITNWGELFLNTDNNGSSILNGRVEGKEGIACVESIGAGGYKDQRYHIRVRVKSI